MDSLKNLSLHQVKILADHLAKKINDKAILIGLVGPLGAGKTTFVKKFAKNFGIKKISSPTFVISHEYKMRKNKFFHLDFYRLKDESELITVGFPEMLNGKNIILIEWVNKFPNVAKLCDLLINFKVNENNKRDIDIEIR